MAYMPANDAPSAKLATAYVTIDGNRYACLMAKSFEGKMNVETKEVPALGRTVKGVKAVGASIKFSMVVYKVTEIFDELMERYKNTGLLPTFDIQTTNEDPATSIGRSTKIYTDCVIDGDVLLSMFDADGDFVEQTIEGYAQDFSRPEKYTNPSYMWEYDKMSNFSAFMKSNKKQRQNELYAATKSLTDENGVPLLWELRPVTTRENEAIREQCTTEVQVAGKPGMYRQRVDTSEYQAKLMAAAVVTPNLNDAELQDSYGVMSAEELLKEMLDDAGEYTELAVKVQQISGFTTLAEDVEAVKN